MADTFHQIYLHVVFAVKYRKASIQSDWEEELYRYTTGIIQKKGHKLMAIGGVQDHIHILIGMRPSEALSDLVREIKKSTTAFILEKKFCRDQFQWQEGYGAFSHSSSQVSQVCQYIENQKQHHRNTAFYEEYSKILKDFQIATEGKKPFLFIEEGEG